MRNYYPVQFSGVGSYVDFPLRYDPTTQPFSGVGSYVDFPVRYNPTAQPFSGVAECSSSWDAYRAAKTAYDAQVAALDKAAQECQALVETQKNTAARAAAIAASNEECAKQTKAYNEAFAAYKSIVDTQNACNEKWAAYDIELANWTKEKAAAEKAKKAYAEKLAALQKAYSDALAKYNFDIANWKGLKASWAAYNSSMSGRYASNQAWWNGQLASHQIANTYLFPFGPSCNGSSIRCLTPSQRAALEAKKPCTVIKGLEGLGATTVPTISDACLAKLEEIGSDYRKYGTLQQSVSQILARAKTEALNFANAQCVGQTGMNRGNCMTANYNLRYREILAQAAGPGICEGVSPDISKLGYRFKNAANDCALLTYMPVCGTCPTKPLQALGPEPVAPAPFVRPVPPPEFTKAPPVKPTCERKSVAGISVPLRPECSIQAVPEVPPVPPCASAPTAKIIDPPVEPTCSLEAEKKQRNLIVGGLLLVAALGGAVYLSRKGKAE